MPPVHRISDIDSGHGCPPPNGEGACPPTRPANGSPNVFAGGSPVVRFSDIIVPHTCPKGGPHSGIFLGTRNVFANGMPIQAMGDMISCTSRAISGAGNVHVG